MLAAYWVAVFAVALSGKCVRAQDPVWVDVGTRPQTTEAPNEPEEEEIEKRYTPELIAQLDSTKEDALLLFTEFTNKAGLDMKNFLVNASGFGNAEKFVGRGVFSSAPDHCRTLLQSRLRKVEIDAQRAATFSGENHHKFFLGHMIVFRMHLNKSEEYVNRCDKAIQRCGIPCDTTPRVRRWRRLALEEIHRVRDDIEHSRRSYRDLVTHARRRLNHIKKLANTRAEAAVVEFQDCLRRG